VAEILLHQAILKRTSSLSDIDQGRATVPKVPCERFWEYLLRPGIDSVEAGFVS